MVLDLSLTFAHISMPFSEQSALSKKFSMVLGGRFIISNENSNRKYLAHPRSVEILAAINNKAFTMKFSS